MPIIAGLCRSTIHITLPELAPSAIRTPISGMPARKIRQAAIDSRAGKRQSHRRKDAEQE
jgi:hypothetical protein